MGLYEQRRKVIIKESNLYNVTRENVSWVNEGFAHTSCTLPKEKKETEIECEPVDEQKNYNGSESNPKSTT